MTTEQVNLRDVATLIATGRLVDETTVLGLLLAQAALGHTT